MGHSWEFDIDDGTKDRSLAESIAEQLGGRDDIWYVGLVELARYLTAVQATKSEGQKIANAGKAAAGRRKRKATWPLLP